MVAGALQKTLMHYEEQGQKKSAKIFEIRNVLRTVLARILNQSLFWTLAAK